MTLFPLGVSRPLCPGLERTVPEPHQVLQFEPSTSQLLSCRKRLHEFDVTEAELREADTRCFNLLPSSISIIIAI